jgi:hypothetical protein
MSIGNICEDNGIRAEGDIIANRNRSEQLSAGSNVDMVPDGWRRVAADTGLLRWKPPLTEYTDR